MQNHVRPVEVRPVESPSSAAEPRAHAPDVRAGGPRRAAAWLGITVLAAAPLAAQPAVPCASVLSLVPQSATQEPIKGTGASGLESPPDAPAALPSAEFEGREQEQGFYAHSGEFWARAIDLHVPGCGIDFVWQRKYRSRFGPSTAQGHGWDFSYNLWIEPAAGGVRVHDGNTRGDVFRPDAGGKYTARQFFSEGEFLVDGSFRLTFADLGRWTFRPLAGTAPGRIAAIADRHGNTLTFQYDVAGRLTQVVDTLGRVYTLGYDASGHITSVTDYSGRVVTYAYYGASEPGGSSGDLKSATSPIVVGTPNGNDFPLGKRTTYTYSTGQPHPLLNHNLLTIVEPGGRTRCTNQYAPTIVPTQLEFDRLVRQVNGTVADTLEITYAAGASQPVPKVWREREVLAVVLNDEVGNVRELYHDAAGRCVRERSYTGRAVNGVPTTLGSNRPTGKLRADDPDWFETSREYDADAQVTRVVHPAGNVARFVYEGELDPAAPARARGNLRELRREPGSHPVAPDQAAGTVELFEYESSIAGFAGTSFLRRHVDARGNATEHVHDGLGNRVQSIARIPAIVDDYTYDVHGCLTSHTHPLDGHGVRRRDDYLWYGPADGAQNGYLRRRIDDAAGLARTTTWTYDAHGYVVSETDPRGNDTLFVRNALGQVVVQQSPPLAGPLAPRQETRYSYDLDDELASIERDNRDEHGALDALNPAFTTTFAYGARRELVLRTEEADAAHTVDTAYEWDGKKSLVLVRQGEAVNGAQPANTITKAYDERDLLWRTTRAAGSPEAATDQSDYDRNANLRAVRRGLEGPVQVETLVHDALDRLRTRTDALGNVTTYHYDPNGNQGGNVGGDAAPVPNPFAERTSGELVDGPGSGANVRLAETTYAYDALDRLVRTDVRHFDTQTQAAIGDGQSRTTQTWTGNTLLASRTLDGGAAHTTTYSYDALGRMVELEDAQGNRRQWSHDLSGNETVVVDTDRSDTGAPDQTFTTSYDYDALDRAVLATDGVGMTRAWGWDGLGRQVRATDRGGHVEHYGYDGLDRLVRVGRDVDGNGYTTDPGDVVLTQEWDDSSRCVARTDGSLQTTRFAWDALDRMIGTLHADGTLEQSGTGMSWLVGQPAPDLTGFVSGYDPRDNLVTRTDANGTVTTRALDLLDRPTGVGVARAPGVGGTTAETWQYDGLSRFVRADVFVNNIPAPASSSLMRGSAGTSGYDSLGNVLRESRQINGGVVRNLVSTFDGESNLTEFNHPASAGLALKVRWTHDGLGRPLTVSDATGAPVTLSTLAYVGPDRLERMDRWNGTRTTVGYDGVDGIPDPPGDSGFRQEIERRHVRTLTGSLLAGKEHLWAQAGTKGQTQDLRDGFTTTYDHDALERLVHSSSPAHPSIDYFLDATGSRTFVSGGSAPGPYSTSTVEAYLSTPFDGRSYDAAGNLASRSSGSTCVYDYADRLIESNDGVNLVRFRYDGLGRCVEKTRGATVERYDYDPLGRLVEVQNGANVTQSQFVHADGSGTPFLWRRSGARYFLHTDHLGSVECVSDPSGNVAASYRYSDFGEHEVGQASAGQGGNLAGMALSDEGTHCTQATTQRADDFTLAQANVVTSLRWWGGYDCAVAPISDDFIVEIRDDASNLPGPTLLVSEYVPGIARVATGATLPGSFGSVAEYEYSVTLAAPFNATAGVRYWLSVRRANDGSNPGWCWESSAQGNGTHARSVSSGPWSSTAGNRAFSLELAGPAIPLSPFLFHGQWYDADSGLYRIGSRAYEPAVGAYLQRDPDEDAHWLDADGRGYTFAGNAPTGIMLGGKVQGPKEAQEQKQRERKAREERERRRAAAQAEAERKAREEAAAKAKKEADAKAEKERKEAEQAQKDAKKAKEKAEREAREAERKRIEAEKRAALEKQREIDRAAEAERKRAEREIKEFQDFWEFLKRTAPKPGPAPTPKIIDPPREPDPEPVVEPPPKRLPPPEDPLWRAGERDPRHANDKFR